MKHPHESQAAAMARVGELSDDELLQECIASGQVSAAQVVAHHEAGETTGWPPGMLQDDSRQLSKALSRDPNARALVREAVTGSVPWVPKTELGRKLAARRAAVLASGMALLSMDDLCEYAETCVAQYKADALRYRWLRSQPNDTIAPRVDVVHWKPEDDCNIGTGLRMETLDKVIDSALAKDQK